MIKIMKNKCKEEGSYCIKKQINSTIILYVLTSLFITYILPKATIDESVRLIIILLTVLVLIITGVSLITIRARIYKK